MVSIVRTEPGYDAVLTAVARLIHEARRVAARPVSTVMTTTYWEIGRRRVEREQGGAARAAYGEEILSRLSADLPKRFGRGFSVDSRPRGAFTSPTRPTRFL